MHSRLAIHLHSHLFLLQMARDTTLGTCLTGLPSLTELIDGGFCAASAPTELTGIPSASEIGLTMCLQRPRDSLRATAVRAIRQHAPASLQRCSPQWAGTYSCRRLGPAHCSHNAGQRGHSLGDRYSHARAAGRSRALRHVKKEKLQCASFFVDHTLLLRHTTAKA